MNRRVARAVRRFAPALGVVLVLSVGVISFWQAWDTADHLRQEARRTSEFYGRIVAALSDPDASATTDLLLALVSDIADTGIPIVVTTPDGAPAVWQNLEYSTQDPDDPRLRLTIEELSRYSAPIDVEGGSIYFGAIPAAKRLSLVPMLQVLVWLLASIAVFWAYRTAIGRDRDRMWVAMARESAHQLGTPLMSARAWLDRLEASDTDVATVARYMRSDFERLERVAQRFERIGRPGKRDQVAIGALVSRVANYFRPRLPRHANHVVLDVHAPDAGPMVTGDSILLEWALESLIRNAIDALSGRGGTIHVAVESDGRLAMITVADDGPGVPGKMRSTIFEPGVSTKSGGWGIGLPLARRIFEDVHGGRLELAESTEGTVFVGEIPMERDADS